MQYEFAVNATNNAGHSNASAPILAAPSSYVDPTRHKIITVGVLVPTTGPLTTLGAIIANTIHLAVEEFNRDLMIQDSDWRLGMSLYNDGGSAAGSLSGMQTFNDAGIKSVIGPATSDSVAVIMDYVEENDMLSISYGSTAPTLAHDDRVFRIAVNDNNLATIFSKLLQNTQTSNVITVYRDDEWGRALYGALLGNLNNSDIELQAVPYPKQNIDYVEIVDRIESKVNNNNTAVILLGFEEILHIVDNAAKSSTLVQTTWYSSDLHIGKLLEDDKRKKFMSDVQFTVPTILVPPNEINIMLDAEIPGSNLYSYAAYDSVLILGNAIKIAGNATDAEEISKIIPLVASEHISALHDTTLNDAGDLASSTYIIQIVKDGVLSHDVTYSTSELERVRLDVLAFNDTNGNGKRDTGEIPLPEIMVLTFTQNTHDVDTLVTDSHGIAFKKDLPTDSFYVMAYPTDYEVTTPGYPEEYSQYNGVLYVENPSAGSTHILELGLRPLG